LREQKRKKIFIQLQLGGFKTNEDRFELSFSAALLSAQIFGAIDPVAFMTSSAKNTIEHWRTHPKTSSSLFCWRGSLHYVQRTSHK